MTKFTKKKYLFPEREIREYECEECQLQFRTDYKEGDPCCPHCRSAEYVIDIERYNTSKEYRKECELTIHIASFRR